MTNQLCICDRTGKQYAVDIDEVVFYPKNSGCYQIYKFYDGTQWIGRVKISTPFEGKRNHDTVELEYGVEEKYRKRGLATAMVEFVLNDLFVEQVFDKTLSDVFKEDVECNQAILCINKANIGSQKVAKNSGFKIKETPGMFLATMTKSRFLENNCPTQQK